MVSHIPALSACNGMDNGQGQGKGEGDFFKISFFSKFPIF